jgi:formate dehydrogenase subunit delta
VTSATDKLVLMLNQIAQALALQSKSPAQATAQHLLDFWPPVMRARITSHLAMGGAGLTPLAREAVVWLTELQTTKLSQ